MRSAIFARAVAPLAATIMGCPLVIGVDEPTTVECLTSADCGAGEACTNGQCGECVPDEGICDGTTPRTCGPDRRWVQQEPCVGETPRCVAGACAPPPSCDGLADRCGPEAESCCAVADVEKEEEGLLMGRGYGQDRDDDADAAGLDDELPEHPTTLSSFKLDVYPVTVGRFRRFVDAYDDPALVTPAPGAGAKPGREESGWRSEWSGRLPASKAELTEGLRQGAVRTWTDAPGENETKPILLVTWLEAFAFCVWDGGRLPTEQEWEQAAAGGSENRRYPWGPEAPDPDRAIYNCALVDPGECDENDIAPVGSRPDGQGRWGHLDLAGNAYQWALDAYDPLWYSHEGASCDDCVNAAAELTERRVARGGSYMTIWAPFLRAAARWHELPTERNQEISFRCAR